MAKMGDHIELKDLYQASPSSTLVGTPASFQQQSMDSYFEMDSPVKDNGFGEYTASLTSKKKSEVSDDRVYPYHVTYQGHDVLVSSNDFMKSNRLKFQIFVAFLFFIFTGLADQTSGTLLPSLVEYYQVEHSVISYIFIAGFCGSLTAAMLNDYLHRTIGIFGILVLSCFAWCLCFLIASFAPPLWALVGGYLSYGLAGGFANGVLNIWGGKLKYHNQIMGLLHACFGFGCMITPVAATYLLEHGMDWRQWYYVLISGTVVLLILAVATFSPETKWKYLYTLENGLDHEEDDQEDLDGEEDSDDAIVTDKGVTLSIILKNRSIWFFSITLFFYLGGEASIGNWVYNYLIIIKKLSASDSSYITSAYWLSLTLGRIVIGFLIGKFFENNETTVAFLVCVLISFFTFFFSISSSLLVQGSSICAIGAFIGPVFPTTIIIALKTLPAYMHALGVGFISSCGSSGGALVPYVIGYVSSMNKDQPGYVEGEGLVYFPVISLIVFTVAMVLWGCFFVYQRRLQRVKLSQSGSNVVYDRI